MTRAPRLVSGPSGRIECLVVGSGEPVTVFAHGLAGSIETTRPFGSGVAGTRAFLHFRGHGASDAPEDRWDFPALAGEVRAVADAVGASRALGVSMGAGALCRLLAETPARFEACVLALPAALDRPRDDAALDRFAALADLVDDHDVEGVARLLASEQPTDLADTPPVRAWARRQARLLVGTGVSTALRSLPHEVPLDDRARLGAVTAPCLVLAQEDDPVHPAALARELAGALPHSRLEVLGEGGLLWRHRDVVRRLVSEFLAHPRG